MSASAGPPHPPLPRGGPASINNPPRGDATHESALKEMKGGQFNTASGEDSAITGGESNTASGHGSSVSGGANDEANANHSAILGGREKIALVEFEAIS